jgi:hypothetical protein
VIVLGIVLLILGLLFWAPLVWVGIILLAVGVVLALSGGAGHPVGGRRYWY